MLKNQNTPHTSTTKQMLTQEDKIYVELIMKMITEKKTTLPSLRNQNRKKVKVKTKKMNKLLTNIPMCNIMELNKLIYTGVKLVYDKISVPLRNPNRNTKLEWGIKLKKWVKKLWQQAKVQRK